MGELKYWEAFPMRILRSDTYKKSVIVSTIKKPLNPKCWDEFIRKYLLMCDMVCISIWKIYLHNCRQSCHLCNQQFDANQRVGKKLKHEMRVLEGNKKACTKQHKNSIPLFFIMYRKMIWKEGNVEKVKGEWPHWISTIIHTIHRGK